MSVSDRRIYFGRHAHSQKDGHVSRRGYRELRSLRHWLGARNFRPTKGISSPLPRSIETAQFLTVGREPRTNASLWTGNDWQRILPFEEPQDFGIKKCRDPIPAHEYVTDLLHPMLLEVPQKCDLVIISHNFLPLQLAWHFLALNGRLMSWEQASMPDFPIFPDTGEGILVQGTEYELFRL